MQATKIHELLPQYVLERAISNDAAYQLRHTLDLYGHSRTLADLQDDLASLWLASLAGRYSRRTIAGHRANLLAFWRWAAGRNLIPPPRNVRRCPRPRPRPIAWTRDEMHSLLRAAVAMPNPDYWECVLLMGYETGLRRTDLLNLAKADVRDRTIWIEQHKTGWPHACQLSPHTADLFLRLPGDRPLKPRDLRRFYESFAALCRLANVRPGAVQQLRRTGATQVEIATPGAASRFLGHRSADMWKHYVDSGQLARCAVAPPRLIAATE